MSSTCAPVRARSEYGVTLQKAAACGTIRAKAAVIEPWRRPVRVTLLVLQTCRSAESSSEVVVMTFAWVRYGDEVMGFPPQGMVEGEDAILLSFVSWFEVDDKMITFSSSVGGDSVSFGLLIGHTGLFLDCPSSRAAR